MGVMEASYISGLTLLGVTQDQAIVATLLYRACTTYLPPIWGWASLRWLRHHGFAVTPRSFHPPSRHSKGMRSPPGRVRLGQVAYDGTPRIARPRVDQVCIGDLPV